MCDRSIVVVGKRVLAKDHCNDDDESTVYDCVPVLYGSSSSLVVELCSMTAPPVEELQ